MMGHDLLNLPIMEFSVWYVVVKCKHRQLIIRVGCKESFLMMYIYFVFYIYFLDIPKHFHFSLKIVPHVEHVYIIATSDVMNFHVYELKNLRWHKNTVKY